MPSRSASSSRVDDVRPALAEVERCRRVSGRRLAQRMAGRGPGPDAAVEHRDPAAVAEVVEHPPQPRRDRAAGVVVGDDEMVGADTERCQPLRRRRPARAGDGGRARPGRRDRTGRRRGRGRSRPGCGRRRRRARPAPGCFRYQRTSTMRKSDRRRAPRRRASSSTWISAIRRSVCRRLAILTGARAPVPRARDRDDHPRSTSLRRSSVVERAAVNRLVVGSSPTAGATSAHERGVTWTSKNLSAACPRPSSTCTSRARSSPS